MLFNLKRDKEEINEISITQAARINYPKVSRWKYLTVLKQKLH